MHVVHIGGQLLRAQEAASVSDNSLLTTAVITSSSPHGAIARRAQHALCTLDYAPGSSRLNLLPSCRILGE